MVDMMEPGKPVGYQGDVREYAKVDAAEETVEGWKEKIEELQGKIKNKLEGK